MWKEGGEETLGQRGAGSRAAGQEQGVVPRDRDAIASSITRLGDKRIVLPGLRDEHHHDLKQGGGQDVWDIQKTHWQDQI